MMIVDRMLLGAVAVIVCLTVPAARAAAPVGASHGQVGIDPTVGMPAMPHRLGTEMVVHDWVLCVSQAFAEQLAHAREAGVEQAQSAYADLTGSRSCGQFDELLVILRKRLYASPSGSDHVAKVFAADVRLSDKWASAFVVYGGLPEAGRQAR